MARHFSMFALWLALLTVGYDRLVKADPAAVAQPPAQEDVYRSAEGGNGLPPPPCLAVRCP